MELSLVPFDDLLRELFRRSATVVIAYDEPSHDGPDDDSSPVFRSHGNSYKCLGMLSSFTRHFGDQLAECDAVPELEL